MFLYLNFIPTNGVSLLSNKFKNRSTDSQKSSKNRAFLRVILRAFLRLRRSVLKFI